MDWTDALIIWAITLIPVWFFIQGVAIMGADDEC